MRRKQIRMWLADYPTCFLSLLFILTSSASAAPKAYHSEALNLSPSKQVSATPATRTASEPSGQSQQTVSEACAVVQGRLKSLNEVIHAPGPKHPTLARVYQLEQNEWRYYCR